MTDLRKAAEMALDAMLSEYSTGGENKYSPWDVIEALRQALAQPDKPLRLSPVYEYGHIHEASQPEQEPVAWKKSYDIVCALLRQAHDILATTQYPIKREWVGLTDEEIKGILDCGRGGLVDIKKAEQILKEKNGGAI